LTYNRIDQMTYWVQQTLPQVYDDSLSFYEVLSKLNAQIVQCVDLTNEMASDLDNFFDSEFTQIVKDQLDTWKTDGTLDQIINQQIFGDLNNKIDDNTNAISNLSNSFNQQVSLGKTFVSVKVYGAIGDGVTDSTTAFEQALSNNKCVFVPDGVYKLTRRLDITKGTHLKLSPNAVLLRSHDDVLMSNWDTVSTGYNGQGNIILEGGTLDVNGDSFPDVANGLSLAHGNNIVVKDVTILDVPEGHAIELTGCRNVTIERCRFLGFKIDSGGNNYYVEAIQIEPCAIPTDATWTEIYVLDGTDTRDCTIQNNYFGSSVNYPSFPCAIGSHGARFGKFYDNIKILNNTIEGCSYWGIRLGKFTNCIVKGNTIRNGTGGGIYPTIFGSGESIKDMNGVTQYAEVCENIQILNNNIINMSGKGIWSIGDVNAYLKKVLIQGNYIKLCGGIGLQTEYSENVKVVNNTVSSNTGRGIFANNVNDCEYVNNTLTSIQENGFFVSNATRVLISDNGLNDIKFYGMNVSSGNSLIWIERNRIKNVSQGGNGQYDGITIATGINDVKVINNVVRQTGTYLKPRYGLNVATGVTNLQRFGNDFKCNPVTANILDNSTTPITSPTDL
jgi:parallel beta-helix repeat protein